jgi:thiamine kinase-like enzyme
MERLSKANSPASAADWKEFKDQVKRLLADNKFVHGDIRRVNVINSQSGLKLLDFDWAGEAGSARYPGAHSFSSICS